MNTDITSDDLVKAERRKLFHALNILPWGLLVLLMGAIAFYFYRQYNQAVYTLNNTVATARAIETITETNVVIIAKTNVVTVTNYVQKLDETFPKVFAQCEKDLRIRLAKEFSDKQAEYKAECKKKSYEEAYRDFQIDAVSNKMADWVFTVKGDRSFKWRAATDETYHGVDLPNRQNPFTLSNFQLSQDINLDIEREIDKIVVDCIEVSFFDRPNKQDQDLKSRLQKSVVKQISRLFDGFETLNKNNTRR
jgi:hypothetical protein